LTVVELVSNFIGDAFRLVSARDCWEVRTSSPGWRPAPAVAERTLRAVGIAR
jgi:hypothetical protein